VLHFGEMGSGWGINRTVGQTYALLYVYAKPLNADEVGDAVGFSRSNVSMGLKELQSWNLEKWLRFEQYSPTFSGLKADCKRYGVIRMG
jgi:DNA-binding transcriptional regulator GbsR (MarR family)